MLNEKKVLNFIKESKGKWYVECKEWDLDQTRVFRRTHEKHYKDSFSDKDEHWKYLDTQDMSNPLDDHTQHEEWNEWSERWIHESRKMDDTVCLLLDMISEGKNSLSLEFITYSWVSNTYTHVRRVAIDSVGAEYEFRFRKDLPVTFRVTPMLCYIFSGVYPKYFHIKRVIE